MTTWFFIVVFFFSGLTMTVAFKGFPTEEACEAMQEEVNKDPDVTAMGACTPSQWQEKE